MRRQTFSFSQHSLLLFLIVVTGAAFFIGVTSSSLPEVVASHFAASGVANGFMPRAFYVQFMLVFVVGLPSVMVFLTNFIVGNSGVRLNLPNRDYWLAPNRRAETIAFLRQHSTYFGVMLVIFLCYVHWLVVSANAVFPPVLPAYRVLGGLVIFAASTIIWTVVLLKRFL